ncbi:protease modulator HflC [Candidatus Aerophobetes bacterium]|uniref:Protein HflC n=1 Tax=Aerophobetes bacterium TaxID=2030807 RepID=A0A523YN42_UNCAE|nr:MAG: protease modulator HflC [Candidatus Aerophobetes bacterium]
MRLTRLVPILVVIIIGLIILGGTLYTVDQTQQVIITQFGEPIGKPITKAGLRFKKPFIQKVNYFEKRLLAWDGLPTQVPTKDKRYIWVDTTARWRIVDPLKFLQTVGSERTALGRLDDIIDSATRNQITRHLLYELVRNSEREFVETEVSLEIEEKIGEVKYGREKISRMILEEASRLVPEFGIELVDVRIKRLNYVERVRQGVYARMIAERKRVAEQYRSEGQGKKAEIEGMREKEQQKITSQAYRRAQEITGKADAEATKIYAKAYNKDPEFYSFLKTLDTYKGTLNEKTWLLLTSDSDFYKYLKSISPKK